MHIRDDLPQGFMTLSLILSISLSLSVTVGARKQSFQFIIHTESAWNKRNNYVIAAQTNSEMKQWITAFKVHTTYIL